MNSRHAFWHTTALNDMTPEQWESLCDGCGLCCLHKLEDEDSGEVYYTDVACRLLDTSTGANSCRCTQYRERATEVENCLVLTPDNLTSYLPWLPASCAYQRLAQGEPLPDWHPLLTGDPASVHSAGISARGRCISEREVSEEDFEEHIVWWVSGFGE